MRLLPQRTFTIETALSPAEAQARLRAGVEANRWLSRSHDHLPFSGVVDGTRFELRRIIHHRNSFVPKVRGLIEPAASGSRLVGTMRVHGGVAAFMAVWFVGVGVACLAVLLGLLTGGGFERQALIPFGMLVVGIAAVFVGFVPEARRALRELAYLVDASSVEMR
jgi:hypothetical protein